MILVLVVSFIFIFYHIFNLSTKFFLVSRLEFWLLPIFQRRSAEGTLATFIFVVIW